MTQNHSADVIYAEYTISRIPEHIRVTFSPEQLGEIRKALMEDVQRRQSAIKFRATLPFFFRRYYLVVMFGRDRRKSTVRDEAGRRALVPAPIRGLFYTALLGVTITAFGALAFMALYYVKSMLGIDIFPDRHLKDVVLQVIDWIS